MPEKPTFTLAQRYFLACKRKPDVPYYAAAIQNGKLFAYGNPRDNDVISVGVSGLVDHKDAGVEFAGMSWSPALYASIEDALLARKLDEQNFIQEKAAGAYADDEIYSSTLYQVRWNDKDELTFFDHCSGEEIQTQTLAETINATEPAE